MDKRTLIKKASAQRFYLAYLNDICCLLDRENIFKPFFVDFIHPMKTYRPERKNLLQDNLVKAVGVNAHFRPFILDATAGFGQDAFLLAQLGCKLLLLEQNPTVFKLLEDGLNRLKPSNMILIQTNAITYLKNLPLRQKPDVIYLDPMFPTRHKSAKVKKPAQLLQALTQTYKPPEEALEKLLLLSLTQAKNRVVLKRPVCAQQTACFQKPNHCIEGKTIRFEVYLTT